MFNYDNCNESGEEFSERIFECGGCGNTLPYRYGETYCIARFPGKLFCSDCYHYFQQGVERAPAEEAKNWDRIRLPAPHGFVANDRITVSDHATNANGAFVVSTVTTTTITLTGRDRLNGRLVLSRYTLHPTKRAALSNLPWFVVSSLRKNFWWWLLNFVLWLVPCVALFQLTGSPDYKTRVTAVLPFSFSLLWALVYVWWIDR